MTALDVEACPNDQTMARMQFSLRTLLAAGAVVGISAALWIAEPSSKLGAVEALRLICIPTSATALVINTTGKAKTFWLGTAAGCIAASFAFVRYAIPVESYSTNAVMLQYLGYHISERFWSLLLAWAFAPIIGLLCVATHWMLIRPPEPKA